jgi:hypothetical protein
LRQYEVNAINNNIDFTKKNIEKKREKKLKKQKNKSGNISPAKV